MPGGNPTKYTENLARKICDRIKKGQSFTSACISEGVSEATGRDWKSTRDAFSRSVQEAHEECKKSLVDVIYNAATKGTKVETVKVRIGDQSYEEVSTTTDSASRVKYAQWLLPRIDPENWSERAAVERIAQAKFREAIQYLMSAVDDHAKAQISTALMAAGFEANAAAIAASSEASG